jgi:hypothetical protein
VHSLLSPIFELRLVQTHESNESFLDTCAPIKSLELNSHTVVVSYKDFDFHRLVYGRKPKVTADVLYGPRTHEQVVIAPNLSSVLTLIL